MKLVRRLIAITVIGAALLVGVRFAEMNAELVSIDYLAGELAPTKLWVVLLWSFGAGLVLAGLLCAYELLRLGLVSRRHRKLSARLEAEIHQLRNLPLAGEVSASSPRPDGRDPVTVVPGGVAERGS